MSKYVFPISLFGTVVGCGILIKDIIAGPKYTGDERLDGKTVIITGANSGIGGATAMQMAKRGANVIMACRSLEKCMKVRGDILKETMPTGGKVVCCKCDLASLGSIRAFVKYIDKTEDKVDILINNAGVMWCPKGYTEEGFEMHLGVNYLGPFLLTNLLLDKLKHSAPSRIVNVTSRSHMSGKINFDDLNSYHSYDARDAYNQSKLAIILFARVLSRKLEGSGVTVNAVYPGVSSTNISRHLPMMKSYISRYTTAAIHRSLMRSPVQGAQTVLYCALEPSLKDVSGKYFVDCKEADVAEQALDEAAAARLWAISESWTLL